MLDDFSGTGFFALKFSYDSKSKTNMIVSTFCFNNDIDTIKKEFYQAGNAKSLPRTSQTHPELISFDNSIFNSAEKINIAEMKSKESREHTEKTD